MKTIIDYTEKLKEYFAPKSAIPTRLTAQTLAVGSTTLTFSSTSITTDSTVVPYADKFGLTPKNITVTTGQAVVEFDAQEEAVSVYLEIK